MAINIKTMPADFGDGWMTNNASDLAKIIIAFLDVTPAELIFKIHAIHSGNGKVNSATVERAIAEIEKGLADSQGGSR